MKTALPSTCVTPRPSWSSDSMVATSMCDPAKKSGILAARTLRRRVIGDNRGHDYPTPRRPHAATVPGRILAEETFADPPGHPRLHRRRRPGRAVRARLRRGRGIAPDPPRSGRGLAGHARTAETVRAARPQAALDRAGP